MIVVERTKTRHFSYVPKEKIPSNSFLKRYNGAWFHILGLDLTGKYWPIKRTVAVAGRLPTDLYMAKHCTEEVNVVYGLSIPAAEKIKIGIFVGLCIAILIVIFLLAGSS